MFRAHMLCRPALLSFCLLLPATLPAQTQNPAPPTASKRSASKSPNVKPGEIVALDAGAETVTIKDRSGKTAGYGLTPKTRYWKNKKAAAVTDFKVGESVIAHVRKSRSDDTQKVTELTDAASWTWLTELRRNTTPATITEIGDDTLTATVGPDATPLTYTISDKTKWSKGGKEAAAGDFKAGEKVYIVPRSLPSGNIMARVVADTMPGAAQMKERQAATVHGSIKALEADTHKITLATVTGDTRTLLYNDSTEIRQSGKTLPFSVLKAGQRVAARVKHDVMGEEVVWRITLEAAGRSKSSKSGKKK